MNPVSASLFYDQYGISATGPGGASLNGGIDTLTFTPEYFSGADVSIYVNGQFLDEVVSLAFTLQQAVQPIFSYASYTYDMLAVGLRLIQGSFTINFTSPFYLDTLTGQADAPAASVPFQLVPSTTLLGQLQSSPQVMSAYPDLAGATDFPADVMLAIVTGSNADINAAIGVLAQYNWGPTGVVPNGWVSTDAAIDATNGPIATQHSIPFLGQIFDITIAYGEIPHINNYAQITGSNNSTGPTGVYNNSTQNLAQTYNMIQQLGPTLMLYGVQITGVQQQSNIDDNGSTILEVYTFIAKDLIKQPQAGS